MGTVYMGRHPQIGRFAAIKQLHPQLATNKDLLKRFFNEARAAAAIRHPGIVEIYDSGTSADGAVYIAMELLEGESLASRLRRMSTVPLSFAVEVAAQIAEALEAAHGLNIVHRDLKPDNLFLVAGKAGERVKVLDFGIAKLDPAASAPVSMKTQTGSVFGTPFYMSPEQCRGRKDVDRRADAYSLGVVLYEMLCGRPPFISESFGELAHMHIAAPPVPPRLLNTAVPAALEAVVLQLLAKEPEQRPGSMKALAHQLRQIGETLPREEPPPPPLASNIRLPPIRPMPTTLSSTTGALDQASSLRGRRGLAVLAAVAGLTVAIGAGLLWARWPSGMAGPRRAGLLLRIEGGFAASSILADDITRALRKELERRRRIPLVPSDDQLALRQATGCVAPEPSCLSQAARRAGARLVLYGSVAREQADRYRLEILLLDAEKAALVGRVTDAFGLEVSTEEIESRAVKWAEALEAGP
jgi:serine/threonine-protein kinase